MIEGVRSVECGFPNQGGIRFPSMENMGCAPIRSAFHGVRALAMPPATMTTSERQPVRLPQ